MQLWKLDTPERVCHHFSWKITLEKKKQQQVLFLFLYPFWNRDHSLRKNLFCHRQFFPLQVALSDMRYKFQDQVASIYFNLVLCPIPQSMVFYWNHAKYHNRAKEIHGSLASKLKQPHISWEQVRSPFIALDHSLFVLLKLYYLSAQNCNAVCPPKWFLTLLRK